MYITADKIHNGRHWMPAGTTLEIAGDGSIISILGNPVPNNTQQYPGVLCPGFVNAHCHLELSHMKGVIPEHTGLIPFLKTVPRHRNDFTDEQKRNARQAAYEELYANGVVAVGDIANTADTMDLRNQGRLHMHTFVESIGVNKAFAQRSFDYAMAVYKSFASQNGINGSSLTQSIVPHAPYSVSEELFRLIDNCDANGLISIHNQESAEEDKYYRSKTGGVTDLIAALGADDSAFVPSGSSSLQTYLEYFGSAHTYILVHNTYSNESDVLFAKEKFHNLFLCLCPNANLYIEQQLPDIDMFIRCGANICIGTDSLASNNELSVLSELNTIKQFFPYIDWEQLLCWGTYNGAQALQLSQIAGSISVGTRPGIMHIIGLDNNSVKPSIQRVA